MRFEDPFPPVTMRHDHLRHEHVRHDRVPEHLRARVEEIVAATTAFAVAHLDGEYAVLCRRLTTTLAREWPSVLERGSVRAWAASIVHAIGWVNFLDDPSQEPHLSSALLATRMGVGQGTMAARSRTIRAAVDLVRLDPAWTRPSRLLDNPFAWMVEVDGVPIDLRDAPRALQEEAFRLGLIPFVPGPAALAATLDDVRAPRSANRTTGSGDDEADDDLSDVRTIVQGAVERLLADDPGATPAQLDAALADVVHGYNQRPQRDLGGLAPATVHRLVESDWESPGSAIRVDDSIPLDDLGASHTLHNARVVLAMLAERPELRATAKGNLPRAFVTEFRSRMRASSAAHAAGYGAAPATPNEDDVLPLRIVRTLLELAGLVKRRRGAFSCTRRGAQLGKPDRAGALLAALVRTHFRRFNLARLDGIGPAPGLQYTIGYTLYQFGRAGHDWASPTSLVECVLLPVVLAELPDDRGFDVRALALETRLLRPLEEFGLAESRPVPQTLGSLKPSVLRASEYRAAPLLARLLQFDVGAVI